MMTPAAYPIVGLIVLFAGLLIGVPAVSLVHALFLRLALWVAQLRHVSYGRAFVVTLVLNYILLSFTVMLWSSAALFLVVQSEATAPTSTAFWYTPIVFFHFLLGAVLLHATVFCQMLPERDKPLRFGKGCFVALVYLALLFILKAAGTFLVILLRVVTL